ncbi:SAM-dependent methyltransferase [Kribbella sp. NBC_01484]|uniref:SAM-dependent methyltransferase n=1 Tax=Kribbella sp. NBC_01484 TaxID=2903579 RepID=UPI002E35C449|nr:SAM-dependent methyltransferase [Kribbella sp. NBC_01484]
MTDQPIDDGGLIAQGIDTTKPSVARVYDYFLGGKDNYESDRELYRQIMKIAPEAPEWARVNRSWLGRMIGWLAGAAGVDRFVDAGSGLPTAQNTHQIAQAQNSAASVVYIDRDPSVAAHGRALLLDNDRTYFAAADLTRPDDVLADPAVTAILSEGRPVALVMALMLHYVEDLDDARAILRQYVDALPPGSYLAISHACNPRDGGVIDQMATELTEKVKPAFPTLTFRTVEEIGSLFAGLELLEPGVVRLAEWRAPGAEAPAEDEQLADARDVIYGGVARKA